MFEGCKPVARHIIFTRPLAAALLLFAGISQGAVAQEPLPPATPLPNPDSGGNLARFFTTKTPYEFWLSCLIVMLGLAVIGALIFALKNVDKPRAEDFARPIIVVTVIIGTLLLVTVGYTNEQIAPAFGLFGTIVGYMLSRLAQTSPPSDVRANQPQDGP
jgi:glycerol uptake facilitator-like aquaporin